MDWTQRMTAALEYLENCLETEVDMEKAASLANCSLFHFCRMFEVILGTGPAEYVRRRRLSKAVLELAASGDKVIDIAMRSGYETPEAFAKAFKRYFGITPTEARIPGTNLAVWPPARLAIVLKGDSSMNYRIIEKPAFSVTGKVLRTTNEDGTNLRAIPQFWEKCSADGSVEELAAHKGKTGFLGLCYDYKTEDNSFAYMIGIETPSTGPEVIPQSWESAMVPKATYVVVQGEGKMPDAIQTAWKDLYNDWFPSSGYEHAGTPDFELYPPVAESKAESDSSTCPFEVWIPIKKKE